MKKAGLLALVVIAAMAVAGIAEAKAKRVATEAEVEGVRTTAAEVTFFGDVHSKKSKCEKNRAVTLVYNGPNPTQDHVVGTTQTDGTGDWEVTRDQGDVFDGDYAVEVDRKKIERNNKDLVCRATTSPNQNID